MSNSRTSTNRKIEGLRDDLISRNWDLPATLAQQPSAKISHHAFNISRFQKLRDDSVNKRILVNFLEKIKENTHGQMVSVAVNRDVSVALDNLDDKRTMLQQRIMKQAQSIQSKMVQVRAQAEILLAKKEEYECMMQDVETRVVGMEDDGFDAGTDELIDEEQLELQNRRLQECEQRKALTLSQLQQVDQEHLRITKSSSEKQHHLVNKDLDDSIDPKELQSLDEETNEMKEQFNKQLEMKEFYQAAKTIMEEFSGINILSVDQAPDDAEEDAIMTLKMLHRYTVQLGIAHAAKSLDDNIRVVYAKLINKTTVYGPRDAPSAIVLEIPSLDDLVQVAAKMSPERAYRFLIREILARITVLQARAQELSQIPCVQKYFTYQTGYGGQRQEICCQLAKVTVVLQLAANCPMFDGTVRVDQIMPLEKGTLDQALLDQIVERVDQTLYRSPVQVMEAVQEHLNAIGL
jgi:hypothetical protein